MVGTETILDQATTSYLEEISGDLDITLEQIRDQLMTRINAEFNVENTGRAGNHKIELLKTLPEICVVRVLLARFRVVVIDMTGGRGGAENGLLAIYESEGRNEGLYNDTPTRLMALVSELAPAMSSKALESAVKRMRIHAPVVRRTIEPHLIPVANGVFDHGRQELRAFRPEWVFLSKINVDYDPLAESPVIDNEDGTQWEVGEWLTTLSDDEGVPELLWEVISAVVRPNVGWGKSASLMGPRGNGGKGTLLTMMRNLVGHDAYASIPLASFGDRFAKGALMYANVNLVDENDVDAFAVNLKDWKACITGDAFTLESKYKNPVSVVWRGFEVQCHNTMQPKIKDKSESLSRRQLFIPLTKSFTGRENTAIKSDYLARPEVLRYVLKRALQMTHVRLSNPVVCQQALEAWFGANNKVVGFFKEHEDQFMWPLLPWGFLYDLYVQWLRKTNPQGKAESKTSFIEALKAHLATSDTWEILETDHRPKQAIRLAMSGPEPLVAEYDLQDWCNPNYTGPDPMKRCTGARPRVNYRGLLHRDPAAHELLVEKRLEDFQRVTYGSADRDEIMAAMVAAMPEPVSYVG